MFTSSIYIYIIFQIDSYMQHHTAQRATLHRNKKKGKTNYNVWRSQTYHIRRSRIYHNRIKANLRGQPVAEIPSEVRSTETSELSCGQSRRLRLRMLYHVAQQHIILFRLKCHPEQAVRRERSRRTSSPPLFAFFVLIFFLPRIAPLFPLRIQYNLTDC